jgi:hypothetical protein
MTEGRLNGILKAEKTPLEAVMLLTVTRQGDVFCLRKEHVG